MDTKEIISAFDIKGKVLSCVAHGAGHINETRLLTVDNNGTISKYILQKINSAIFTDSDKLMSNILLVTEFNKNVIAKLGGEPERESLSVLMTKDNKPYFRTKDGDFRMYPYIDGVTYQVVKNPHDFYISAVAFGKFMKLLANFDATKLYEVIPNFHNTESRFNDFVKIVKENKSNRAKLVQEEIEFVFSRKKYCSVIVDLLKSGEMPTRVTHNDTKLNNILFDKDTGKSLAILDLDTMMPGSLCYDFGDSIRFGCNPCEEDEQDLSKVNFDINLFEEYAKGYLTAVGDSITKIEKKYLAFSSILITYECGMRFLGDYIDGDHYFRIDRENQNLDRARTQFKLVSDMEKLLPEMEKIVAKY